MLRYRLIFGAMMIAGLVGVLYLDDHLDHVRVEGTFWQESLNGRSYLPAGLVLLATVLILIVVGSRELVAIFRAKGITTNWAMIALAGVAGCMLMYALPHGLEATTAAAVAATVLFVLFLAALVDHSWAKRRTEGAVAAAATTLFAFMYIGLLPGFYVGIRRWHSAWVVAAIILVTKSCDIGAYFTGRLIGRHKLIPWLSPGKTWEGLVGGVALAAAVAAGVALALNQLQLAGYWRTNPREFVHTQYPLWAAPLGGILLGLVGQFGDLVASLFKRDAGFKDSGKSIPGFGGLLDVMDSPLVVAPLAYWLLRLAAMGQ